MTYAASGATGGLLHAIGVTEDVFAVNLVVEQVEAKGRFRLRLAIQVFSLKVPDLISTCWPAPMRVHQARTEMHAPAAVVYFFRLARAHGCRLFFSPPSHWPGIALDCDPGLNRQRLPPRLVAARRLPTW